MEQQNDCFPVSSNKQQCFERGSVCVLFLLHIKLVLSLKANALATMGMCCSENTAVLKYIHTRRVQPSACPHINDVNIWFGFTA